MSLSQVHVSSSIRTLLLISSFSNRRTRQGHSIPRGERHLYYKTPGTFDLDPQNNHVRQVALSLILFSKRLETWSSCKAWPRERKLAFIGYLLCTRHDVKAFHVRNFIALSREHCEVCVCVCPFDAEEEAQKRYRIADVTMKREAEEPMVFLWPHAASLETP